MQNLFSLQGCLGAATALALTACVSVGPAKVIAPPPSKLYVNTFAKMSGFGRVTAISYFSEAEMSDAAWEFARIQQSIGNACAGYSQLVRRDVKWFPATEESGQACAMAVYTVECFANDETGAPAPFGPESTLERDRQEALRQIPQSSPEKACGDKDIYRLHPWIKRPESTPE